MGRDGGVAKSKHISCLSHECLQLIFKALCDVSHGYGFYTWGEYLTAPGVQTREGGRIIDEREGGGSCGSKLGRLSYEADHISCFFFTVKYFFFAES